MFNLKKALSGQFFGGPLFPPTVKIVQMIPLKTKSILGGKKRGVTFYPLKKDHRVSLNLTVHSYAQRNHNQQY